MLDEFGYVPASKVGAELLFDVISTAYERTSVVVTTNLPFEQWTEVLGSERLAGAALDRLTHRCHILETNGRELPAPGRQAPAGQPLHARGPAARIGGGIVRPAAMSSRYKRHASGAALLHRPPLHYSSVVHIGATTVPASLLWW